MWFCSSQRNMFSVHLLPLQSFKSFINVKENRPNVVWSGIGWGTWARIGKMVKTICKPAKRVICLHLWEGSKGVSVWGSMQICKEDFVHKHTFLGAWLPTRGLLKDQISQKLFQLLLLLLIPTSTSTSAGKSNYAAKLVWGDYCFLLLLDCFQLGLSPLCSFLHSQHKFVLSQGRLQRQDKQNSTWIICW